MQWGFVFYIWLTIMDELKSANLNAMKAALMAPYIREANKRELEFKIFVIIATVMLLSLLYLVYWSI